MKYLLPFLCILCIVACKPRKQTSHTPGRNTAIENKRWVLREMNGKSVSLPVNGKEITLKFSIGDGAFQGDGGCNKMSGVYTVQEDMIKMSSLISTKMACDQLQVEGEYFKLLESANRYEFKQLGDKKAPVDWLYLYIDKTTVAKFESVQL